MPTLRTAPLLNELSMGGHKYAITAVERRRPTQPRAPLYTLRELEFRFDLKAGTIKKLLSGGHCEGQPVPVTESATSGAMYRLKDMANFLQGKGLTQ